MTKKIRVGVAGYGTIGQRLADGVALQGDMELVGVADLAPTLAIRALKEKGMPYRLYLVEGADKSKFDALGIPRMEAMIERYAARTGLDEVPDMNWYFAFNLFRLAGIVQGIKKRVIDGNASNDKAAEMAKKVPFLADSAWHFARAAGASE